MKTVYLNLQTSNGRETVDEFSQEENQSTKDFNIYVNQMVREYHIAGMAVYKSSRPCQNWKDDKS